MDIEALLIASYNRLAQQIKIIAGCSHNYIINQELAFSSNKNRSGYDFSAPPPACTSARRPVQGVECMQDATNIQSAIYLLFVMVIFGSFWLFFGFGPFSASLAREFHLVLHALFWFFHRPRGPVRAILTLVFLVELYSALAKTICAQYGVGFHFVKSSPLVIILFQFTNITACF